MGASHWLQITLTVALVSLATGARILAVLPYAYRSHQTFHQAVLKTLAQRGHQVVVYGPFPQQKPIPNYVDVYVNTSYTDDWMTYELLLDFLQTSNANTLKIFWENTHPLLEDALRHENIQKLMRSDDKFDLVLVEPFIIQEVFLVFGHKFKAPTIALSSLNTFSLINAVMGNSLALSYIPEVSLPLTNSMTLYEKYLNSYAVLSALFSYYHEELPYLQTVLDRHFKFLNPPPLREMLENISLVLLNANPATTYAQPRTPNMISVGGIHLSPERKPLPQGIQKFMDEAGDGVIYFSLGTFVPDHRLPPSFYSTFVRVFQKLKQRVLWKTRAAENITGLSDNVMLVTWAPQQDILNHPKCVLFLTHGGLLSQMEVIHAGVPVVGVPFLGDQDMNVIYYETMGVGVKLDFLTMSEMTISAAIHTVLSNPKYKEKALELSREFRDLPMTQADTAVFWVEYVLRHRGAQHLRPASARMSWYELVLLDVVAVAVLVASMSSLLMYLTCKTIYVNLKKEKKKDSSSKKKN